MVPSMDAQECVSVAKLLLQLAEITTPFDVMDLARGCGFQIAVGCAAEKPRLICLTPGASRSVQAREVARSLARHGLELGGRVPHVNAVESVADELLRWCAEPTEDESAVRVRPSADATQRRRALAL